MLFLQQPQNRKKCKEFHKKNLDNFLFVCYTDKAVGKIS